VKLLPFDQDRFNVSMAQAVRQLQRAAGKANRPTTYEISPASQYGAVATFYVNGSSIGTVTLASGDTRIQTTVNVRVKNTDGIQVVITTAGTGAKGLSAFLRMKG
jgi:hypothetical protein